MNARVLVVGLERDHYDELFPLLNRSLVAVDRISNGEGGVELCAHAPFGLIVVRYPLTDMSIGSFMQRVHEPGSLCAATPIMVLADDNRLAEIRSLLPGGAKQALSVNQPEALVREAAARLKLSPRRAMRVPVKIEVRLAGGTTGVECQSENLSEKGLLVRSNTSYRVGAKVTFSFVLPGERAPIQGEAEVVRHAEPPIDEVKGMGLYLTSFKNDGQDRVRRFVARAKA